MTECTVRGCKGQAEYRIGFVHGVEVRSQVVNRDFMLDIYAGVCKAHYDEMRWHTGWDVSFSGKIVSVEGGSREQEDARGL